MMDVSKATCVLTREHIEEMAIFVGIDEGKARRLGELLQFVAKLSRPHVEAAKEDERNG